MKIARSAPASAAVALLLTGCGLTVPTDPEGTLDRVRNEGVIRVGVSPSPGWVELAGGGGLSGREPDLVEDFAASLDVEVEWTVSGEEDLVTMLKEGEIDLAVGGFTEDNAWVDQVGLTRPYTDTHVMMVPMGENALQSELERWLDEYGGTS